MTDWFSCVDLKEESHAAEPSLHGAFVFGRASGTGRIGDDWKAIGGDAHSSADFAEGGRWPRGRGWDDEQIAEALDTSLSTIHRVRRAYVEEGLEEALYRKKPTGRQYRKLDGDQEAHLIAVACSKAPEGRARWTLRLLADKLVELKVVESISSECVRTTLKKTTSSPGCRSNG